MYSRHTNRITIAWIVRSTQDHRQGFKTDRQWGEDAVYHSYMSSDSCQENQC